MTLAPRLVERLGVNDIDDLLWFRCPGRPTVSLGRFPEEGWPDALLNASLVWPRPLPRFPPLLLPLPDMFVQFTEKDTVLRMSLERHKLGISAAAIAPRFSSQPSFPPLYCIVSLY